MKEERCFAPLFISYPRSLRSLCAGVVSEENVNIFFARLLRASWWFAFGFGEEFFGFDFVAATVDRGDEVIFAKEIDEHGQIFVVHDNNRAVVIGHEFELHFVSVVDELVLRHFFVDVEGLEFFHKRFFVLEQGIECQAFGETELIFVG